MPIDERGPGGKKPARVEVLYFPKRGRDKPYAASDGRSGRSKTLTVPEFRPDFDEDLITEPHPVAELPAEPTGAHHEARRATPPWHRRSSPKSGRKPSSKGGDRRRGASRGRDPGLKSLQQKVEKMLSEARRSGGVSTQQLAEVSLFGHQLFEGGRLEEARVVFEGLVGLEVRDAFPYTMLGTIYLALGDQDRALALFEAALGIDRTDLAALVYRGEIRLNRGKLRPALDDLHRAVELGLGDDPFVDRAKRLLRLAQDLTRRAKSAPLGRGKG